jgi:endonuclease/exonuclease/phosphatase family metal-dependent hydrolase
VKTLISLSVMLLLAGSSLAMGGDPVNVMTYNIRYLNNNDGLDHWNLRADKVAETIREGDIIGLQEATRPQIDGIAKQNEAYDWYGVGRDDGKDRGEFCPIFWKKDRFEVVSKGTFWLGPDAQAVGKPAWGANLPRICSWLVLREMRRENVWVVLNTHFDHQSPDARLNSARLIRQMASEIVQQQTEPCSVVLTGDLNCSPESPPFKALIDKDDEGMLFVDSFSMSESKPTGATGTWNAFRKIADGQRIDFVLLGQPQTKVLAHETLDPKTETGRFASDHLPVVARLQ